MYDPPSKGFEPVLGGGFYRGFVDGVVLEIDLCDQFSELSASKRVIQELNRWHSARIVSSPISEAN